MAPQILPMAVLGALTLVLAALGARACMRSRLPVRVGGLGLLMASVLGLALLSWSTLLLWPALELGEIDCIGRSSCRGVDYASVHLDPVRFWMSVASSFFIKLCGLFVVFMTAAIGHGQLRSRPSQR